MAMKFELFSGKRRLLGVLALIGVVCWFAPTRPTAHGQATFAPAAFPGVILTFESPEGKPLDARESRLIALSVPAGSAPSPFVPPGPFRATFRGFINLKIRDQYAFTASGRGTFELFINGESVLKASGDDLSTQSSGLVRLKKGANELVAHYIPPDAGDALLRLSWAEKNKPLDPIPPTVLTHGDDALLAQRQQLRAGRELVAHHRCLNCHVAPDLSSVEKGAMPELAADAPSLADAGSRFNPQWMARWIADPRSLRHDATMPKVFARAGTEEAGQAVAADLAAYLATRKGAIQTHEKVDQSDGNALAGARLFLNLGCIACHPAPSADEDPSRTSLRYVAAKYQPAALFSYLKKPESHYAWTPMPNFGLSDSEAEQLAAYLLKTTPADALEPVDLTGADPERGLAYFQLTGCVRCHEPETKGRTRAKPIVELVHSDWSIGCLSETDSARENAPDFGFSNEQRASLRAFAQSDWSSLARDSLAEFAQRSIQTMNCTACHTRDAQEDRWSKLKPEIEALEQSLPAEKSPTTEQLRPLLTWTGEKLRVDWAGAFVAGKVEYKPRPWLTARMPAFPARAEMLAQGMCLEHGLPIADPTEPAPDPAIVAIGRQLSGRVNGFSCNQCHAINQTAALVPFDSPAPNFMYVSDRLRKDFYHRWTRTPNRYMPNTKMPTFADLEGKTAYKTILEGDARTQFEAIWQYLRAGHEIIPPE